MHVTHNMDFGGTEQVIRQVIAGFDSKQFVSSVVCIDGYIGEIGQQMIAEGIQIDFINRGSGFNLGTISSLRRLVLESKIDILHCHQYTPFCYGVMACIGTPAKAVFTEHGRFHPDSYTWKRRLVNQVLYRLAHKITCISQATRQALAQYEWIPAKRIEVIYNGVRAPQMNRPEGSVREFHGIPSSSYLLGTIARLDPIKNQCMMIEAFAEFQKVVPDSALIIAGDGPERATLQQRANQLGVKQSIQFSGFVTDIADYLDAFDVFLLTSFSEGTSMTLLEALATGKVIIATMVGGNVEVLEHGKTGMLVPSGDQSALLQCLIDINTNDKLCSELSANALLSFEKNFSNEKMSSAYTRLYDSL